MKKICIKCGRELELNSTNFNKRKDAKDGFRNDCKTCRKESRLTYFESNKEQIYKTNQEYRDRNREKINTQQKQYREENIETIKERRSLRVEQERESSRRYWKKNRERLMIQNSNWKRENAVHVKKYKLANREREKELARKRYKTEEGRKKAQMRTNSYRAKKKSLVNDLTLEEWNQCLNYFNNKCAYCGCESNSIEQEHFVPVTKGGAFTKNNILPACRSCNASKLNKDFFKWFKQQKYYSLERETKILNYLGREINDSLSLQGCRNK